MTDTPTIEQVREMPAGPDMDALVARIVMGWTKCWRHGEAVEEVWSSNGEVHELVAWWTPSTDLNDAWRAGGQFEEVNLETSGGECYATVYQVCGDEVVPDPFIGIAGIEAPALALSRAVVIAKLGAGAWRWL